MDKKKKEKRAYQKPEITVYLIDNELLVSASIIPNASDSTCSTWQWDEETHDGGSIVIDDGSTVAPAKRNQNIWDDND